MSCMQNFVSGRYQGFSCENDSRDSVVYSFARSSHYSKSVINQVFSSIINQAFLSVIDKAFFKSFSFATSKDH